MKSVTYLKIILVCVAALSAAVVLTGCSTTKGFGEDIQTMGRGISGAADDAGAR